MTRLTKRRGWVLGVLLVLLLVVASASSQEVCQLTPGAVGGCWYRCRNDDPPPDQDVPEFGDPAPLSSPDGEFLDGDGDGAPDGDDGPSVPRPYDGMCCNGPCCLTP